MNFLTAIIDGLVRFVQRNPLTTLVILILAIGAPALLRGIALFFLYFIMGVIVLVVAAILLFRWRVYKMRRRMEEQFRKGREGEVKVYNTSETPEKRVSRDVGDYVEFEETKEPGEE